MGIGDLSQKLLTPSRNDDLVSESVKRFGKAPADTGSAACDENGIVSKFHSGRESRIWLG